MTKLNKQLTFARVSGWGGKRTGAGRPNFSHTPNHMKRELVDFRKPLHITMRLRSNLPNLRTKSLLKEFKESAKRARRFGIYVLHFSLQRNHIHMICEAPDNSSLARGMRSLAGRFGKILKKRAQEFQSDIQEGSVFQGRYHLHVLKTPTETKRALEYVLFNKAKHEKLAEHIDEFSSALNFKYWKELLGRKLPGLIADELEFWSQHSSAHEVRDALSPPRSWLARVGWMRA